VSAQDPRHGSWRQTELGAVPVLPASFVLAQLDDAPLDIGRRLNR